MFKMLNILSVEDLDLKARWLRLKFEVNGSSGRSLKDRDRYP